MSTATAALLADGRRLHLQHGPIDLVIGADAPLASDVMAAYRAAALRFSSVLAELLEELPRLRTACPPQGLGLRGSVARRMEGAVSAHAARAFITPMAAVAGAVADEILAAMTKATVLTRAYVNNGGDIALHLSPGTAFSIAVLGQDETGDPLSPADHGRISIAATSPVRGIATSGRGGRSFSLGIADSVTVLARDAAAADAAATLIANAVDLPGHEAVVRARACDLQQDSDLQDRLVTVSCKRLAQSEIDEALGRGETVARSMRSTGLIDGALLVLQGETRHIGGAPTSGQIFAPTARGIGAGLAVVARPSERSVPRHA